MVEFHLLTFECLVLSLSVLDSDFLEGVVVSLIIVKFLIIEMDDFITSYIQELSSM